MASLHSKACILYKYNYFDNYFQLYQLCKQTSKYIHLFTHAFIYKMLQNIDLTFHCFCHWMALGVFSFNYIQNDCF